MKGFDTSTQCNETFLQNIEGKKAKEYLRTNSTFGGCIQNQADQTRPDQVSLIVGNSVNRFKCLRSNALIYGRTQKAGLVSYRV